MSPLLTMDLSRFVLNARGPLASVPALDVMWISFYSIGVNDGIDFNRFSSTKMDKKYSFINYYSD